MTRFGGAIDTVGSAKDIPTLPSFDLGVEGHSIDAGMRTEAWGGVTSHHLMLSDGTEYRANVYMPDRQASVWPVTYTTPWCTDLAGFNDHIGTMLAREGALTIAVSPEQTGLAKALSHLGKASLAHDAEVHHVVLDQLASRTDTDLSKVATIGYSRGAMVGFGIQAYADGHKRQHVYNDYTDPCLEHRVSLREIPWLTMGQYCAKELGAVAVTALPKHGRSLHHLVPTFIQPPGFWVSQVSTGLALFRGEAGRFIDYMPTDSRTHVTLFTGSVFNQARAWEERMASLPNVTIERKKGVHFTGANMDVVNETIGRIMTAAAV